MKVQHFITAAEVCRNYATSSSPSTERMRSPDEHQRIADESNFRHISSTPLEAMKSEWMKCPRCKNKRLMPDLLHTDENGSDTLWWVCENYMNCSFPLNMPRHIYTVTQTAFHKQDGFVPLPDIPNLPVKYRHLYPVTFADSRPVSRCSSGQTTKANSRNETSEGSSTISSEKSSGLNRLKADAVQVGIPSSSGAASSTSEPNETSAYNENIDEEVAAAAHKPGTTRVVRRKRYHDSNKSWASLIEKVASDPTTANRIINMEESELFNRMKEFFDEKYFRGSAISFKRRARLGPSDYRSVTYRVDDMEHCLRAITDDEWLRAKRRLPPMNIETRVAFQSANTTELLKTVGIDLNERRKAVSQKVGNVMKGFRGANMAKRKRLEDSRKVEQNQKKEVQKQQIHQSVSARLLNRKMRRDDEERSLASTPTTSCYSEPIHHENFEPAPVHFHIGNEPAPAPEEQQPEFDEDGDYMWNFDLNGLYDDYNAQNQPVHQDGVDVDPMEAMLFSLDDQPTSSDNLNVPVDEEAASETERSPVEDQFSMSGFDSFSEDANLDFVQDNFDF